MWQNRRACKQEILDLGPDHYSQEEYDHCLQMLCRVNWLLGGFKATLRALRKLKKKPLSILEVGCGGGYQCHRLHRWFPKAKIVGIDISQQAIDHAQNHLPEDFKERVSFTAKKDKTFDYSDNSYDVVTTMLVTHHMTDKELVIFLKESYRVSSQAVIINDLQRHILAYLSFSMIAPFVFPNRLIWHDGRLSVKRSFRRDEWIDLMEKAGFQKNQYTIKWNWPFRWSVTLKK